MFDSVYTKLKADIVALLSRKENKDGLTPRKLCNLLKMGSLPMEFALGQLMFEQKVKRSSYGRFVKVEQDA